MRYTLYGQVKGKSLGRRWRLGGMLAICSIIGLTIWTGIPNLQQSGASELAHRTNMQHQKPRRARISDTHWKLAGREDVIEKITTNNTVNPAVNPVLPVITDTSAAVPTTVTAETSLGPNAASGVAINPAPEALLPADIDHREYMHGMDFVTVGGKYAVIFSANGYLPTSPKDEWMDDIYYSYVDPADPRGSFSAKTLVSASMAQEPASSAVNSNGRLMVTAEDAQYSQDLDQTFGIWNADDSGLTPTTPYGVKLMPPQGGHSGHVAASGDKFLVSFSDGWIDGGGVDNMGTGDDVFGKIVNEDGTTSAIIKTSVGKNRDWWPIVAGSDSNWLQVWQRYGIAGTGGGTVMGALIDHSGKIVKQLTIFSNNKYYYHDVQYVPALGMYLVTGSQNTPGSSGVAVLIDKDGNIVATKTGLPSTNRESQTVISDDGTTAVYPVPGVGAAVLDLTSTSIALRKTVSINWNWDYMGTDGIFTADNRVVFATGSQHGVKFITADF